MLLLNQFTFQPQSALLVLYMYYKLVKQTKESSALSNIGWRADPGVPVSLSPFKSQLGIDRRPALQCEGVHVVKDPHPDQHKIEKMFVCCINTRNNCLN